MSTGLGIVWSEWERRLSVAAGALVAFLSLLQDCPVWVSCARGLGALVVVGFVGRSLSRLIAWSQAGDRLEAAARVKVAAEAERPLTQGERRG